MTPPFIEQAQAMLETGHVCDGCLGRCFADRSQGLSSGERGHAIRVIVAMDTDESFEAIEPKECWVCKGLALQYDDWVDRTRDELADIEFQTFLIGAHVPSFLEENEAALREQAGLDEDAGETFKDECKREVGHRLEQSMPATVDHDYPDVVAILDLEHHDIGLQLNPAYLFGRYRKLARGLTQLKRICRVCNGRGTQWREGEPQLCEACGGSGYDTKESVEWYITEPIREALEGDETVFNAAGREDDDVLMLETGRPFVVEVKEPRRRPSDLGAIEREINAARSEQLEVFELSPAHRDLVQHLVETPVQQTYRLTASFESPVASDELNDAISELDGASIRQQVERERRTVDLIHPLGEISGELAGDREAVIEIRSSNELDLETVLTGGGGTCEPSLAGLLATSVTDVEMAVVRVEAREGVLVDPDYLLNRP